MSSPGEVDTVVASAPYDDIGFTKFSVVSEGRKHKVFNSVDACEPPSLVG